MPVLKQWFDFTRIEFKKYVLLGTIFAFILGIYWALRPLKDALFEDIIGAQYSTHAKWLSLIVLLVLVPLYSWLVDKFKRESLFYLVSGIYGSLAIVFALFMLSSKFGLELPANSSRILGWSWYVYVESFGALIIALFWAFAADISRDEVAQQGFSLIFLIGQLGGWLGPMFILKIPYLYKVSSAYAVIACGLLMFLIIPLIKYFISGFSPNELKGFEDKTDNKINSTEKHETGASACGFLEGLKLLVSQPYLISIFAFVSFYAIIESTLDYYFKVMVNAEIGDKFVKLMYLGDYASYGILITLLFLFLGMSTLSRRLNITIFLSIAPILLGIAALIFRSYAQVNLLFWLMVIAKGISGGLTGPALRRLYVPTTKDSQYKAGAWIQSFGFRSSLIFSFLNIAVTNYLFFGLIAAWLFVAIYLGRTHQKAVNDKRVIC